MTPSSHSGVAKDPAGFIRGTTLCAILIALVCVGCSPSISEDSSTPQDSSAPQDSSTPSEGDPRVLISTSTSGAGFEAIVSGTLGVTEKGCVTISDYILIAPRGSTLSADGELVTPGYAPFRLGTVANYTGGYEDQSWSQASPEEKSCLSGRTATATVAAIAPELE